MTSLSPQQLLDLTKNNKSFSREVPGFQTSLDSTSLGEFKTCPRKYQLSLIEGWQPKAESVHLTFGILIHKAREAYDHAKLKGLNHDDALLAVTFWVLKATWNSELKRPWLSDHPGKNRLSLVRSVVWYLDHYGPNEQVETLTLANGKPAVELSFRFDSSLRSRTSSEPILLCGHIDRIGVLSGDHYICDLKTSSYALSPQWFKSFSPNNQFSLYSLAGKVAFGTPTKGLILDGLQVGATFTRVQRGLVPRDEAQLDEWFHDTSLIARSMEVFALEGYWPMNDTACDKYGGCKFRGVCSQSPARRAALLGAEFERRIWDPTVARGE